MSTFRHSAPLYRQGDPLDDRRPEGSLSLSFQGTIIAISGTASVLLMEPDDAELMGTAFLLAAKSARRAAKKARK